MKSTLITLLAVVWALPGVSQCNLAEKVAKQALGTDYIAHPTIFQWTPIAADSLMFESLWLSDNTYRIATSTSEKEKISIQLFDELNNPIFDNSTFGFPSAWTFFAEHSMNIRCVIKALEGFEKGDCLIVMTGFKK